MRVFELHFNPGVKEDLIFDSFCYEPENIYEKRLGSLYMAGELRNALPQNSRFLNSIAQVIKGKYYAFPVRTPEQSFKESLKKINEFLAGEVSKENVSWLGNLNFAILFLKPPTAFREKCWEINFTKTGDIKILLLRGGEITDIGENLEFQDIEPYPLKVFVNIVSGKLTVNDKILVLTKEVFEFLSNPEKNQKSQKSNQNLIQEIAKVAAGGFDEKKLREILPVNLFSKNEGAEISGVCLLIDLSETQSKDFSDKPEIITFQKELEKFSIKEALSPLIRLLLKVGLGFKRALFFVASFLVLKLKRGLREPAYKLKNVLHFPKLTHHRFGSSFVKILPKLKTRNWRQIKKGLILVSALFLFLLIGFFIFQIEEKQQLKKQEAVLNEVQEKINQAEKLLIFKEVGGANILFKESWEEILSITEKEGPLKNEANSLKEVIEENLRIINKLEKIADPQLIFEFNPKEFIPQKMVIFQQNLYLFDPFSENIFKVNPVRNNISNEMNENGEKVLIPTSNQKFNLAVALNDALLFFSKPNRITSFKNSQFGDSFSLKEPYSDFTFSNFSAFQSGLYFLDSEKGEVVKYAAPLEKGKDFPQLWLNSQTKKATDSKSMAVNGSIWILKENNTISRYYAGQYQKDLTLDFFPYPKKLYKITALPNSSYLYILEPVQNRIIILDKNGEIIKQFQSEKFDNLKDFAVSDDAKTIYLLNGLKVYKIEI